MKKIKYTGIIILLSIVTVPLWAQQLYKGQINMTSGEMAREGDSLYVHVAFDMSKLEVGRNRSLTLTPIVTNGMHQVELPDILINGTTRNKAYLRSQALGGADNLNTSSYAVVKLDKKSKGMLHYRYSALYEKWMDSAHLDLKENLCGCGGHEEEVAQERLIENIPPVVVTPYEVIPQIAYIQPKVETLKSRNEEAAIYLNFPVNRTNILPDYMNNPSELARIENMLRTVNNDNNLTVTGIDIIGYASPEGYVADNQKLSEGRTEAFKRYLISKLNFPANLYKVKYGGENWEGLIKAVGASDMEDKDAIIDIVKNTHDLATRKTSLKALNGGAPYRQMLQEIYPKLRKVVSKAHYNVKGFSVEEAKQLIGKRPQQLSLHEMFRVANTYKAGSVDFSDVFETAVKMYPDDEVANLNAAAAALSEKNIQKAERYLQKSDINTPEYINNMGVLYLLNGDLNRARNQFDKASQSGLDVAKYNLKEIEKKIENDALIK